MAKKIRVSILGIVTVLMCFALAFALISRNVDAQASAEPIATVTLSAEEDFVIDETGKLTGLSDAGNEKISGGQYFELVFPAKVTWVASAEFTENAKLVKVSFASGSLCTSIAKNKKAGNTFAKCTSLREADFSNATKLTAISNSAFYLCTSLNKVIFPERMEQGVTMTIGSFSFASTALTSFTIPQYVNQIDRSAFSGCMQLKTMEIAPGNDSFMYYTDASGNRYDQAVYTKNEEGNIAALSVAATAMEKITLPSVILADFDDVTSLYYLLDNIQGLKSVDIEENNDVYALGNCLFIKANGKYVEEDALFPIYADDLAIAPYSVEEMTLPGGFDCESSGDSALYQDTCFWTFYWDSFNGKAGHKLKTINVQDGNTAFMSIDGVLYKQDYSEFWIPYGATSFTVPTQVTGLDFSELAKYKNLREVNVRDGHSVYMSIDGSLFTKDYSAFFVPSGATSFTVPKEMPTFDFSVLAQKSSLREVKIEEGHPTYISDEGLIYDKGKTELLYVPRNVTEYYAPATLTKIGETVFAQYDQNGKRTANTIEKVYVEDLESWCKIQFGDIIETEEQREQAPDGSLSKERRSEVAQALRNGYGANPMSGGASMYVRDGDKWALLEYLTIDYDGGLSDLAFAGCTSLRTVLITDKVTRIGEFAFACCVNIRSVTVPYVGCTQEFTMWNDVIDTFTYVYEPFGGRGDGLTSGAVLYTLAPVMMDVVTVTGYNIWKQNGQPVYGIPSDAFSHLPVKKVVVDIADDDGHELVLGKGLFIGSSVSEVDLSNSKVVSVADTVSGDMFAYSNVKEVTLPATLKNISQIIFNAGSTNLIEKVTIPEGVEYIASQSFSKLNTLTLPTTIGGFNTISGVKTVYLTGFTPRDGQFIGDQYSHGIYGNAIYVAVNSDVYAKLPDYAKESGSGDYVPADRIFYQAEVTFILNDAKGNELSRTTEMHLAGLGSEKATFNYRQITAENGDVYWAIDKNYALPERIGNYKADNTKWKLNKADNTKWKLNDAYLTAETPLIGSSAKYEVTQIWEEELVQIIPADVTEPYDGKEWTAPGGFAITDVDVISGGNGYYYSSYDKQMPSDAGTYLIKAVCDGGYTWCDGTSANTEHSFTLTIVPVEVDLRWFYTGSGAEVEVTGSIHERAYDGISAHRAIYAKFSDVGGVMRTIDFNKISIFGSDDLTEPVYAMSDAGLYTAKVFNNSGNTADGVWLGNYVLENEQQFRINKLVIDLNDYDTLAWGLSGYNSPLRDGDVYIYDEKPYVYERAGVAPDRTLNVLNSIVRLRDADSHGIEINNIPALLAGSGTQYTVSYLGGNRASEVGIYTATATLTVANGNYEFGYSLGGDLKSRGMTITINSDGTATVSKIWYLVTIDNGMLAPDGTEYKIAGWQFGADVVRYAPRLEHGDEDEEYLANGNIRFALTRDGKPVVASFFRDRFNYYINKSMPAGVYELTCTVANVKTPGSHVHWWNNEAHDSADANVWYHGFERKLVFEVSAATIGFTLAEQPDGGYYAYEWENTEEVDKETFFDKFATVALKDKVSVIKVAREGYWATDSEELNKLYANYSVSYNFARMYSNTYYSASDGNIQKLIKGGSQGTYTVYFNLTAPNHVPLTEKGGDGRYAYFFTVTVYETLAVPTVNDDGLVYTGSKVLPEIAEDAKYNVVWSEQDTYIGGGKHTVDFVLTDSVHYRWADGEGVDGDTATVVFTVAKAENVFNVSLNMLGWNFETFDAGVNNIRVAARFLDSGKSIRFRVTRKGEDAAIEGLSDFGIDGNGRVDDTVAGRLNGLKTGEYTLYATVVETDNYKQHERYIDFQVSKAMNAWATGDEDLVLPSWVVGKYDPNENKIVVNAAHGKVNIIITDMDGNEYYNSVKGTNKLAECEVGKYMVKAWVDETADYAKLDERTFTIDVLEAVGLPWWAVLLIVVGSLGVAALIIFILWKKGVFEILTQKIVVAIRTKASVDATIASVRAAKKMEEGKQSVADAKRRERIEQLIQKSKEQRALPPEERAAQLEAKAQADEERADKLRAKVEATRARARKMRGEQPEPVQDERAEVEQEAAATDPDTPDTQAEE